MNQITNHRLRTVLLSIGLLLAMMVGALSSFNHSDAAPGSTDRLVISDNAGASSRVIYFPSAARTPVGVNTPISSSIFCGKGEYTKFVSQLTLTGTLSGTAPTLATKWQHSYDGGTTWIDVGAFTTINATVTPAAQVQTVSDIAGSTAVAYGDCWRATLTFGGTTPGGTVALVGMFKP